MLHDIAVHSFRSFVEHRLDDGIDVRIIFACVIGRQYSQGILAVGEDAVTAARSHKINQCSIVTSKNLLSRDACLTRIDTFHSCASSYPPIYEPFQAMRPCWLILIGSNDRVQRCRAHHADMTSDQG